MPASSAVQFLDQRTPEERGRGFLPGMGKTWLLPLYDSFTRVSGIGPLHARAVEIAGVAPAQRVLDVGCGTGNLAFAVLAAQPEAAVTGLDPDGAALRRAARKARRRGASVTLVQGFADRFPAEDASLDHVVSSLALHHIDDDGRARFAGEARRSLRSGGRVTIVDFGGSASATAERGHQRHGPAHALRHLPDLLRSRLARKQALEQNSGGALPALLAEAGFSDAREVDHLDHRLGRVSFVQATRP